MKEFLTKVGSPVGLHARPASLFAKAAKESGCRVSLAKVSEDGTESPLVDGVSLLKIMALGIKWQQLLRYKQLWKAPSINFS
ncbi:MAG: hypothetical protein RL534_890 [Actinomycetota bacterium]